MAQKNFIMGSTDNGRSRNTLLGNDMSSELSEWEWECGCVHRRGARSAGLRRELPAKPCVLSDLAVNTPMLTHQLITHNS